MKKYKFQVSEKGNCQPMCEHKKNIAIGSIGCQICEFYKGRIKDTVYCNYPQYIPSKYNHLPVSKRKKK